MAGDDVVGGGGGYVPSIVFVHCGEGEAARSPANTPGAASYTGPISCLGRLYGPSVVASGVSDMIRLLLLSEDMSGLLLADVVDMPRRVLLPSQLVTEDDGDGADEAIDLCRVFLPEMA